MDNLSHSIVGLAAGELIHRTLKREDNTDRQVVRHRLLLFACWLASNFPDLDLILTPLLPTPLGYLLHHRGHTHTLLYALPQALLLWLAIRLWPTARQLLRESASARIGVIATISVGLVLHMMMDFLNSYGIHPFHPFDSRWLYGDMVFIIEPFFWITFGVPLALMVPNKLLRWVLLALLAGVPLYFTMQAYLPWGSLAALAVAGIVAGALQRQSRMHGRLALVAAFCISIGFVLVQNLASTKARETVVAALHANDPASRFLDASMTSYPTNPLCWNFVSVESNEGAGVYTLRRGVVALVPDVLPVTACPSRFSSQPFEKVPTPAIGFQVEERSKLAALRELRKENCYFEAWLRFARAPALDAGEASDMRFGWRSGDNFTAIRLSDFAGRECPVNVPGWDFPRSDLLKASAPGKHQDH